MNYFLTIALIVGLIAGPALFILLDLKTQLPLFWRINWTLPLVLAAAYLIYYLATAEFSVFMIDAVVLLGICLWASLSRISLLFSLFLERSQAGRVAEHKFQLQKGYTCQVASLIDYRDLRASHYSGRLYVTNKDGRLEAHCERYRGHVGPSNDEALYINGNKLGPNQTVVLAENDRLYLRHSTYAEGPVNRLIFEAC